MIYGIINKWNVTCLNVNGIAFNCKSTVNKFMKKIMFESLKSQGPYNKTWENSQGFGHTVLYDIKEY